MPLRHSLFLLLLACRAKAPMTTAASQTESITKTTEEGPVKATVVLSPAKPKLGDRLTLTLTVEVRAGVDVEMPPFGEALGRFSISEFVPRSEAKPGGGTVHSQKYVLEAPGSGKHRLPSLRVAHQPQGNSKPEDIRELLTPELTVEVASLLSEELRKAGQLRPLRGTLSEHMTASRRWLWIGLGSTGLAVAIWLGVRTWRRRAKEKLRVSAFDLALKRLMELQAQGLPEPTEADPWYVKLSDIVRRYIEDRFTIRAPDLTTEEFLREAGRSLDVAQHRQILEGFLVQCDRVKFGAYQPAGAESQEVLSSAKRFLEETRLREAA